VSAAEYEIVVRGRLGIALAQSLDDVEIRASGPDATYLRGWLDQSALQSLLTRIGDLGLEISSVRRLPDPD
jgi:hypothetical protein